MNEIQGIAGRRAGHTTRARLLCRAIHLLLLALTSTLPITAHARTTPLPAPEGHIILTVAGAIRNTNANDKALFDLAMLKALPHARLDTHTSVSDGVHRFDGFLMRDLLRRVQATGSTVSATALNDYVIDLPIEEFDQYDVVVAYEMDGAPLLPSDKGPLWIVYPRDQHAALQDIRYDYRWVWQLMRLDVR